MEVKQNFGLLHCRQFTSYLSTSSYTTDLEVSVY